MNAVVSELEAVDTGQVPVLERHVVAVADRAAAGLVPLMGQLGDFDVDFRLRGQRRASAGPSH
ncbi:hypothetical protein ACFXKS_21195 [Streptomyces scopuliridis]|uniref:hypothetical protein n=1 Tax=Streptomyces scopuliridis TaxID=452529 RepID=UPI003681C253